MRLLLDTHVVIWWDVGATMARDARRAIRDADEVYVSAASSWEIAIKTAIGKIQRSRSLAEVCEQSGFRELPVLMRHADELLTLPHLHRDPFDRLLVAQAIAEDLVLVTRDPAVAAYPVGTLMA